MCKPNCQACDQYELRMMGDNYDGVELETNEKDRANSSYVAFEPNPVNFDRVRAGAILALKKWKDKQNN